MANPWLAHVKKTMRSEAGKKKSMGKKWFSHVLKSAKGSYKKKTKRGGAGHDAETPAPPIVGGKRKTRRHSRR